MTGISTDALAEAHYADRDPAFQDEDPDREEMLNAFSVIFEGLDELSSLVYRIREAYGPTPRIRKISALIDEAIAEVEKEL